MLVIREDHKILRVITTDRKCKFLGQKACFLVYCIHSHSIFPCCCTEKIFTVRRKRHTGSCVMKRIIGILFSKSGNALKQLELRVLTASVIAVYLHLIAELKKKICKSSVITETDDTRAALSRAAKNVNQLQFVFLLIDTIDLNLIDTIIYRTEILIIRCRTYTINMRTEVTLCHASKSLVENAVHNTSQTAVFMCMYNRYLTIMVPCHIKISSVHICCKIAASHSVDIHTVEAGKITVLVSFKYSYTFILNGIQIFTVF